MYSTLPSCVASGVSSTLYQCIGGDTKVLGWAFSKTCEGKPDTMVSYADIAAQKCKNSQQFSCSAGSSGTSTSSEATCFASSETVQKESGETIFISEVRIGDRILAATSAGDLVYSSVIAVPHAKNNVLAQFVILQTANGKDLILTEDHLLLSGPCISNEMALTKASSVEVGFCVKTVDGDSVITAISTTFQQGIYTIVTEEKFVVVSGIVASPFAVSHEAADWYYSFHRTLFRLMPSLLSSSWFMKLQNNVATFVATVV